MPLREEISRRCHGLPTVLANDADAGKGCYFLAFVQPFEKYGTLIERYTALIEKVSPCIAAAAELWVGAAAAPDLTDMVFVTLGTGIGVAVVLANEVIRGATGTIEGGRIRISLPLFQLPFALFYLTMKTLHSI
eukprot:SAG31_NODE_2942_length_4878_cov_6.517263_6_plen_134_part_00